MKKFTKGTIATLAGTKTLGTILEGATREELKFTESILMDLKETEYINSMIDIIGDLITTAPAKKEAKKEVKEAKKEVKKEAKKEVKEAKKEVKKEAKKEVKEAKQKLDFNGEIKVGMNGILEIKEVGETFYFKVAKKEVRKEERYYISKNKVMGKAGKMVDLDYYTISLYSGDKYHIMNVEIAHSEIKKTCFKIAQPSTKEVLNFKIKSYQ